jgi:hypothetical protein
MVSDLKESEKVINRLGGTVVFKYLWKPVRDRWSKIHNTPAMTASLMAVIMFIARERG